MQLEKIHDALNEISDLVNTAVATDKMTIEKLLDYFDDRLERIYGEQHKAMCALVAYENSLAKDAARSKET